MDAKWSLVAALALSLGFNVTANAADESRMIYERTIAPVAFNSCDTSANVCDEGGCDDGGCDTGRLGKIFGDSCDDACDSLSGCNAGLLGYGIIKKSDTCFNDFISPMTNPVFFEDPRSLTEARAIFIHHELPDALGGNSVQVYALQLRARLTERLSIIATKDGLIYTQSDLPILDSGIADLAAGLKYNLYRDPCAGRLLSTGFTYEAPLGSNRALQGNGNGEFNFFLTGGSRVGARGHVISAAGFREPTDDNLENRIFYWSNHFDVQVPNRNVWLFAETNWFNYLSSAGAFPLAVEGGDLFNLGAPGITGNDLVTGALGVKLKPRSNLELGSAYEVPLTEREGLMQSRFTFDCIVRY